MIGWFFLQENRNKNIFLYLQINGIELSKKNLKQDNIYLYDNQC